MKYSILALAIAGALAAPAAALAEEGTAAEGLKQFRWTVSPGLYIPTSAGDPGFTLTEHIGYGIGLGPVVVSPGLSVPFFVIPNAFSLSVLGEAQVHYPIGPLSPYFDFGLGVGIITGNASSTGLGLKVGAGAIFFFNSIFGLGLEFAYNKVDQADILHFVIPIHFEP